MSGLDEELTHSIRIRGETSEQPERLDRLPAKPRRDKAAFDAAEQLKQAARDVATIIRAVRDDGEASPPQN